MLTATYHDRTLFPGQDYNNARVLDFQVRYNRQSCTIRDTDLSWDLFQKVDHYVSNQLSIIETGRMPWHDVHMTITGPSVLDISQHYIERWNEVKKRKVRTISIVVTYKPSVLIVTVVC